MMQTLEGKPKIIYPTPWEYRVIGRDRGRLKERIMEVMKQVIREDFSIQEGKSSSGGKFVSVVVRLIVSSQDERDRIFGFLQDSVEVDMVL